MDSEESQEQSPKSRRVAPRDKNLYTRILEDIFENGFEPTKMEVRFTRKDITATCKKLGLEPPSNIGDLLYTFRYRADIPASIASKAPPDTTWVVWPAGRSMYRLAPSKHPDFPPSPHFAETKVPDSTPGIVLMYSRGDEQALLARIRYNRLVDIFTGVTTYPLQSHWRTFVKEFGQIETDEVYVGIDKRGAQYVFPVQAKDNSDTLHVVQVAQDFEACKVNFPGLICRPIGAQFMDENLIALFQFEGRGTNFSVAKEAHYRLVPPADLSIDDLASYRQRPE